MPSRSARWGSPAHLAAMLMTLWWSCSAANSVITKNLMRTHATRPDDVLLLPIAATLPAPLVLGLMTLFSGSRASVIDTSAAFVDGCRGGWSQIMRWCSLIGLLHGVGVYLTATSLISASVPLAQAVKASDPVFGAFWSFVVLSQTLSCTQLCAVCLVVCGVIAVIAAESAHATFSDPISMASLLDRGVLALLGASCCFQLRNAVSKSVLRQSSPNKLSPTAKSAMLFLFSTSALCAGCVAFVGVRVVFASVWVVSPLLWLSGITHFIYQMASFGVLSFVQPMAHSLANTMKRAFIVAVASVYFNSTLPPRCWVGFVVALVGSALYARGKSERTAQRKSSTRTWGKCSMRIWVIALACVVVVGAAGAWRVLLASASTVHGRFALNTGWTDPEGSHPFIGCTAHTTARCRGNITCGAPEGGTEWKAKCTGPSIRAAMYYFMPYGYNFGDAINLPIAFMAAGGPGTLCSHTQAARSSRLRVIMGLGSVLNHVVYLTDHVHAGRVWLWGTGHIGRKSHFPQTLWRWSHQSSGDARVTPGATRGRLTLEYLRRMSWAKGNYSNATVSPPVQFGDPALLLPLLFPHCRRACRPTYPVCFVPHHSDEEHFRKLVSGRVPPGTDPAHYPRANNTRYASTHFASMVEFMMDCALVVSTSLHGIVVAEAFGVPARWLSFPGKGAGESEGTFKYHDYYTGTRPELLANFIDDDSGLFFNAAEGIHPKHRKTPKVYTGPYRAAHSIAEAVKLGGAPPIDRHDIAPLLRSFPGNDPRFGNAGVHTYKDMIAEGEPFFIGSRLRCTDQRGVYMRSYT